MITHAVHDDLRSAARILCSLILASAVPALAAETKGLDNLARKAAATASFQYGREYTAQFAIDGKIPAALSRADAGAAWCVIGETKGEFSLQWPKPVTVSEVVYYGRTAWQWEDCWKDYEVYAEEVKTEASVNRDDLDLGDAMTADTLGSSVASTPALDLPEFDKPIAKGQFRMGHGPQRIKLERAISTRRIRLKFLSSYGGPTPGASEIQVYASSPSDANLGQFVTPDAHIGAPLPAVQIAESPALAARLRKGELGFAKLLVVERQRVNCSHVYTYHCEGQKDGGGMFLYDVATSNLTQLVASPDGQILDCDLSYDAKEILFSWRKGKFYQVYRINADGAGLTQLTKDECYNFNACWLPDGGIGFLSTRKSQFAYCWTSPVGVLHRMSRDGSNVLRISANYLNDFTPAVMNDGRLIYGRWEYVDRPAIPIQSLWTINPDGTGLSVFFGNRVLDPATFIEPQAIPGTSKIVCTLTGHNGICAGAIGIIDPIFGDNAQEAIRNLTPEVGLRGVAVSSNGPRGPYQNPFPVDQEFFLLSHNGTILLRDYDGKQQTVVLRSRGMGFWNSAPLRPRVRPPSRPSELKPAESRWAAVFVQDVYNGLEPQVKRGEVKQICVVQEIEKSKFADVGRRAFGFQFPVVSCGATYAPKMVWGYARVRPDGSAYFKVPANAPIYFMALDDKGRAVQRMRSFTHLMPGETQGCVGCHEPRTQTPLTHRPTHPSGDPEALTAPEWGGPAGFDYSRTVQPVLDRQCVKCHNAHSAKGIVDLTGDKTDFFNVSYEVLAREGFNAGWGGNRFTSSISSYNGSEANILQITPKFWGSPASKLADLVLSGHPDRNGKKRLDMDEPSMRRIFAWIDLNIPYYGTAVSDHPDLPGCRQMYPRDADRVLGEVAQKRCASCHNGGRVPRKQWMRITSPELNSFLLAPLAASAGGTEACGKAIFATKDDPDYRAILQAFAPINELISAKPRADMPGAQFPQCCPKD